MGDSFQAVLVEGLFYFSGEPYPDPNGKTNPEILDLRVRGLHGDVSIYDTLRPLTGSKVYLAVHHVPTNLADASRWAGGSCLWQPAPCPFGHHMNPSSLFNLAVQGVLLYDRGHEFETGEWSVIGPDGHTHPIPLSLVLPGHIGRVACATMLSVEQMRDSVLASGVDVEALGRRANNLRELVSDLARLTKKEG